MTTAIVLGALLSLVAFAAIVRLSMWGLRSPERADSGERGRQRSSDDQRDRLAA